MLYKFLKQLIYLASRAYFRKVYVLGRENIPKKGPVIFVANHPNALLDPLIAAVSLSREVHFLAGSEWFGSGMKNKIFRDHLNMIPVYRPWLQTGTEINNRDMFEACYEVLGRGECIIIFPEASSESVSKIRELKTGAVRIMHGLEKSTNGTLKAAVIPIGLSYSNAHAFQSRVVVKIGAPVVFNESPAVIEDRDLFRDQTEQLKEALKRTIIHIDNTANERLVNDVYRLYMDTQQERESVSLKNPESQFEFNNAVASAVNYFEHEDPENYQRLSDRTRSYFRELNRQKVSDDFIGKTERSSISVIDWMYLILGFPLALASLIVYLIPYQLTRSIFLKKFKPKLSASKSPGTLDTTFTGTLIFGIGTIVFLLWIVICTVSIGVFVDWIWAGVAFLVSYPLLRIGLHYAKIRAHVQRSLTARKFRNKDSENYNKLAEERKSIIAELEKLDAVYEQVVEV